MNNNSGKENFFVISITILIFIFLGLIIFNNYKDSFTFKSKNNNEKEATDKKKDNKDKTDEKNNDNYQNNESLKSDLSAKIDYINEYLSFAATDNFKGETFDKYFNNLDYDTKLHLVLIYLCNKDNFTALTPDHMTSSIINAYLNKPNVVIKEISGQKVNNEFRNLFGEKIPTSNSLIGTSCYTFYYDKSIDTYFWVEANCKENLKTTVVSYINKYSFDDDIAYVYVNYGLLTETDTVNQYNIYTNLEKNIVYQNNVTGKTFEIDESNYERFSQYKYTFQKSSGGNYYVVRVEKA